ncbi:MAG: hypothetical protein ACFFAS_03600 [Promethearchaeota archaeon]
MRFLVGIFGFSFILGACLLFINLPEKVNDDAHFNLKVISSHFFKLIILFLMLFALFIPPSVEETIALWTQFGPLNYYRALIFLIGSLYLPGSCLYEIAFKEKNIFEQFGIEMFLTKIVLYPLISLGFLGLCTLVLDQLGLIKEFFVVSLFLIFIFLFVFNLIFQEVQGEVINIKYRIVKIKRSSLPILLLIIGISAIAIGLVIGSQYPYICDNWIAAGFANYIGKSNLNPLTDRLTHETYPVLWGYITFSLSALTGMPLINLISMLVPLSYISVGSIYIITRIILHKFDKKYAFVASLFFLISFQATFNFSFSYKSFAFFLFLMSLAFFYSLIVSNSTTEQVSQQEKRDFSNKLLLLTTFFFIVSCFTYIVPFLMGFIILTIISFFSKREVRFLAFKNLVIMCFLFLLFFLLFDAISFFYFSRSLIYSFMYYTGIEVLINLIEIVPPFFIIFVIIIALGLLFLTLSLIFKNKSFKLAPSSIKLKYKLNSKKIYVAIVILLVIFLISYFIYVYYPKITKNNFYFFYASLIISGIEFLGIVYICFFYPCLNPEFMKHHENLIMMLSLICFIIFTMASAKVIYEWIHSYGNLEYLTSEGIMKLDVWFDRLILYIGPFLCIFGVLGVYEGKNTISKLKKARFKTSMKKSRIALVIGFILVVIPVYNNFNIGSQHTLNDEGVLVLEWVHNNVPYPSSIIAEDDDYIWVGIVALTYCSFYSLDDIFDTSPYNQSSFNERIAYLISAQIQYLLIDQDFFSNYMNASNFIDNFYNDSIYQNGVYTVYRAPFF